MSQLKIKDGNSWINIPAGGIGVPSGGNTGDFLVKSSSTDYATEWEARPKEWGTPIEVSFPFTAACDGVFFGCVGPATSGDNYIYVAKGSDPADATYAAVFNPGGSRGNLMFPVHNGETYSIKMSSNSKFYTPPRIYPLP